MLTDIQFLVTNKCRHPCKICHFSCKEDGVDIPVKLVKKIIDEGKELGVKRIMYNGGEPLDHSDFRGLMDAAKGMDVTVITNGWDYFSHRKELTGAGIVFSLEGMDSKTHDWSRGKGSFEHVMNAIRDASKSGIGVTIQFVVTNRNFKQLNNLFKFADEMNIASLIVMKLTHDGYAQDSGMGLDQEQEKAVISTIRGVNIVKLSPFLAKKGYNRCRHLSDSTLNIDWNGNINICSLSTQFNMPTNSAATANLSDVLVHIEKLKARVNELCIKKGIIECDDCLNLLKSSQIEIFNIKCKEKSDCKKCIYHKRKVCLVPLSI